MNTLSKDITHQFTAFLSVGFFATLSHFLVLIFLVQAIHLAANIASSAGALVGAMVSYLLNYKFTFASKKAHKIALTQFLIVASIGFCLNWALITLFAHHLNIYYIIAQCFSTGIVLLFNFFANRHWTFSH